MAPGGITDRGVAAPGGIAEGGMTDFASLRPSKRGDMTMADMGRLRSARNTKRAPVFFSGVEALTEVAKPDGKWNWALVAPDPAKLPLSAGGHGPVEEMQDALANHPCLYGLFRLSFHHDSGNKTKWVFIQASNADDDDSGFSARERGQANMKLKEMAEVLDKMVRYAVKCEIKSREDCNLDYVLSDLQKATIGWEADIITVEHYQHAKKEEEEKIKEEDPELATLLEEEEEREKKAEEMEPPTFEDAVLDVEPEVQAVQTEMSIQRQKMKLLKVGDTIEVYSNKLDKWFLDGEVVEVVDESSVRDGATVRAGSMKVVYQGGKNYKWVMPQQMSEILRESIRPKAPKRRMGQLYKETHNWFMSEFHVRFVDLNRGFLQWWVSEEEMIARKKPQKSISLLGLHLEENAASLFKIRTAGTKGVFYTFDGKREEVARPWIEAIWEHYEYAEEVNELEKAKDQGIDMRKELLASMQGKRKSRADAAAAPAAA